MAVQVLELLEAATAAPPPNAEKLTVTLEMIPELLSPPAVSFQVAVTVSPIVKAPPVPEAPEIETWASVTVGAALLTVMPLPVRSAAPPTARTNPAAPARL